MESLNRFNFKGSTYFTQKPKTVMWQEHTINLIYILLEF